MGCTIPIAPAAETAATSSALEQGYMAPPIRGSWLPASRVSGVASGVEAPLTVLRASGP